MAYLETGDLHSWASRSGAATQLPSWVERAIKVGLLNHPKMRFLKGAFNGLPGVDGWIRNAQVRDGFKQYIPEGDSIWEFSVQATAKTKIRSDAAKRMAGRAPAKASQPKGAARTKAARKKAETQWPKDWKPETTTIVFVTPRGVADADKLTREIAKQANWKEIRILDGQRLFDWLENCPAISLAWAAEIHGVDASGLKTFDMAWDEVAGTTSPKLTKEIVIAGRDEPRSTLLQKLKAEPRHIFVRGDSEFEAHAFVLSALQDAECQRERTRTLIGLNYEAALQARSLAPSIFLVGADKRATTSALSETHRHHVVVAYGDPVRSPSGAIELERPLRWNFAKGLETAGIETDEADRLARECGSSVTVMCRRRPSGVFAMPWWAADADASFLRPLTLLGRWDSSNADDRMLIEEFSERNWDDIQQSLLNFINRDNAPFTREGQVWALGSHVDSFVILAPRLGDGEIKRFVRLVRKVFAPTNPMEMDDNSDDVFKVPKGPSDWLKNGVAQALLLLAVRAPYFEPTLSCPIPFPGESEKWHHGTPNALVDALISELPALGSFPHLYDSIKQQFAVLLEAAPDPLLDALERWLEGSPDQVRRMLSTKRGLLQDWPDATELLWGLEALAWSPDYLLRVCQILAALSRLYQSDGGRDTNRPLEVLSQILMWWSPQTFAPLSERTGVVDRIIDEFPDVGWALLLEMRPTGSMIQSPTAKPRMRDLAPAEQEVVTRRIVFDGLLATIRQILSAADHDVSRWVQVVGMMSHFPPEQREEARHRINELIDEDLDATVRPLLWEALRDEIARHRTYAKTPWALRADELRRWDDILSRIGPTDPVLKVKWLFDDWMPDLDDEMDDESQIQARIERRRLEAARSILNEMGVPGVLRLAEVVKHPNFVGSAVGAAIGAERILLEDIAKAALANQQIDVGFVAALLWSTLGTRAEAALDTGGELFQLAAWARESGVPVARIASILIWLPGNQRNWEFISAFGKEVEDSYWQLVSPPFELTDSKAVKFLTKKMLDAGRAAELSNMAAFGRLSLEPGDALALLDAVIKDLSSATADGRRFPRSLREFVGYLSKREDIKDAALAQREILLVPVLGYHHGLDLRLFKVLSEEPGLFLDLVCQLYRPEAERGMPVESDELAKKLATRAYQILSSWHHQLNPSERRQSSDKGAPRPFPGEKVDGSLDAARLMAWVTAARKKAQEADRLSPADNEIGQLLAYSRLDPDDHAWPAREVRAVIEKHYSKDLQAGLLNEQFNKRGVHGVVGGGKEEQAFSDEAKQWAKIVRKQWPRTNTVLLALARMWERDRDRAIEWERQRKLEQRL